uniref:SSD domain-containing protein n=1 Tax=Heterorhabditis bacteriophora TaxID=37862 RepID=A0A1I7XDY1_HETBA
MLTLLEPPGAKRAQAQANRSAQHLLHLAPDDEEYYETDYDPPHDLVETGNRNVITNFLDKHLVWKSSSDDYNDRWKREFRKQPSWCDADLCLQQIKRGKAKGNKYALYSRSFIQKSLFALGNFVHSNSGAVIIIVLALFSICCYGLQFVRIETDIVKLWVGGRLDEELNFLSRIQESTNYNGSNGASEIVRENGLGGGYQVVIQTPKYPGQNVLDKDPLLKHVEIMREIAKFSVDLHNETWSLSDICFKPAPPELQEGPASGMADVIDRIVPCIWITPIDCFWEGAKALGPHPSVMTNFFRCASMKDFLFIYKNLILISHYLQNIIFKGTERRTIHPLASTSIADMLEEFCQFNYKIIFVGYGLMVSFKKLKSALVYAIFTQMKREGCLPASQSCMGLALAGVLTVTFASIAGLGLATWFGIEFNAATTQIVPFLTLGIGVDNMFMLLHNYHDVVLLTNRHEMGILMRETGMSILCTSINNILSFLTGTLLPIPALRSFCAQSSILLTFNFISILTLYPVRISAFSFFPCVDYCFNFKVMSIPNYICSFSSFMLGISILELCMRLKLFLDKHENLASSKYVIKTASDEPSEKYWLQMMRDWLISIQKAYDEEKFNITTGEITGNLSEDALIGHRLVCSFGNQYQCQGRIPFYLTGLTDTPVIIDMIEDIRSVCDRFNEQGLPNFPQGIAFTFWEQYLHLTGNLLMVGEFDLITSFSIFTIYVFLGLNVHQPLLIVSSYLLSMEPSPLFLVSLCLVFQNSSMLFSFSCLLFKIIKIHYYKFRFVVKYFFVVMSALIVIGIINGLILLPVLLSLIGPPQEVSSVDGKARLSLPPRIRRRKEVEADEDDEPGLIMYPRRYLPTKPRVLFVATNRLYKAALADDIFGSAYLKLNVESPEQR